MRILFGGTRGTSCVADSAFMAYGGDTTCVLVVGRQGDLVILDAGTGLRRVTNELKCVSGDKPLTLLMSHFHLDHLMGLPSFSLLYRRETTLMLGAARRNSTGCREIMHQFMMQPIWPVEMGDLEAGIRFVDLDVEGMSEGMCLGSLRVRWCKTPHPGGSTAYRIEEDGIAFIFATDLEWPAATQQEREALKQLCLVPFPATCLVMDGQFTSEEYPSFKGWGHGIIDEVGKLASEWGVAKALVTHHSPHHDDEHLTRLEEQFRAKYPNFVFARDGLEIVL